MCLIHLHASVQTVLSTTERYCLPHRHSLHAIATQLSPVLGCTGIELLKADTFDLHCFQTLTGTKIIMVVEPSTPDVDLLLKDTCVSSLSKTYMVPLCPQPSHKPPYCD